MTTNPIDYLLEYYNAWFDRHITKIEGCAINAIVFAGLAWFVWTDPRPDIFYIKAFSFVVFYGWSLLWLYLAWVHPAIRGERK